jgi:hypothetical protein
MLARLRLQRPSPAMVVALVALFIALGGSSYAAVTLSKNSVGAAQIKRNAVKAAEVARNAVGASEIRANAVAGGDVADGTLGSFDIGSNAVGLEEAADGSVGSAEVVDGSLGEGDLAPGLLDVNLGVTVQRTDVALADNTSQAVEASCLPGTTAVAGGSSVDQTGSDDIKALVSRPGNGGFIPADGETFNDWRAVYRNPAGGTGAAEIRAFVVCVAVG